MKKIVMGCLISLAASWTYAYEYNFDLSGGLSSSTHKYFGGEVTDDTKLISGQFYFQPISLEYGPFDESIFMGKQSYFSVAANYSDYDATDKDGFSRYDYTNNSKSLAAIGEIFTTNNLYFLVDVSHTESTRTSIDSIELNAGFLLNDTFLVYVGGIRDKYSSSGSFSDTESNVYIGAKKVLELEDKRYVNIEGTYLNDGDGREIDIAGDFYFSNAVSVGLVYSRYDDKESKQFSNDALATRVNYYIDPSFKLGFSVADLTNSDTRFLGLVLSKTL